MSLTIIAGAAAVYSNELQGKSHPYSIGAGIGKGAMIFALEYFNLDTLAYLYTASALLDIGIVTYYKREGVVRRENEINEIASRLRNYFPTN